MRLWTCEIYCENWKRSLNRVLGGPKRVGGRPANAQLHGRARITGFAIRKLLHSIAICRKQCDYRLVCFAAAEAFLCPIISISTPRTEYFAAASKAGLPTNY